MDFLKSKYIWNFSIFWNHIHSNGKSGKIFTFYCIRTHYWKEIDVLCTDLRRFGPKLVFQAIPTQRGFAFNRQIGCRNVWHKKFCRKIVMTQTPEEYSEFFPLFVIDKQRNCYYASTQIMKTNRQSVGSELSAVSGGRPEANRPEPSLSVSVRLTQREGIIRPWLSSERKYLRLNC